MQIMTLRHPDRRLFLIGLAALALAGCASGPQLSRLDDPEVDLRVYRTFAFAASDISHSLIDRRLYGAARQELERRGYGYDVLAPELLVNIAAELVEPHGARVVPGSPLADRVAETDDQLLGRLAVDLIDLRRRQVVWHGSARGRVTPAMLREPGVAVERAVAAIFDGFPVRADHAAATRAPGPRRESGRLESSQWPPV